MPFYMKNNAFLMSGNKFAGCCCVGDCYYIVTANILWTGGAGLNLYGSIDGNTVVWASNITYPGAPDYELTWGGFVEGSNLRQTINSGQGFVGVPDDVTVNEAHNFRFWYSNVDNGDPSDGGLIECYVKVTCHNDPLTVVCANGVTLDTSDPDPNNWTTEFDLTPYLVPGDGDQSGYTGAADFDLAVTCGACP